MQEDVNDLNSDWKEILDKILEEQHNCPFEFDSKHPLPFWRLLVLERNEDPKSFTLVFIFHHALMDTKSALSFHHELEGHMVDFNRLAHSIEPNSTIKPPSLALIPPLEGLYALPISEEFLRSQEKYSEPSSDSWTAVPQFTPVKTRFSSLWLSGTQTKMLTVLSKKESTSVTAVLQTLIATCLFSVLPSKYNTIQGDCAVSLRRFLPKPVTEATLGCYVGSISTTYNRAASFDWDEARRTKAVIEHTMAQKGGDMPVGYLKFIQSQHNWMLQKLGRKRMSAFELSNVGASSPLQGESCFGIESMLFSQSSSACSAAIKISAVTGRDGRLALGFTWQEGAVEDDMIDRVRQALKSQIEILGVSR